MSESTPRFTHCLTYRPIIPFSVTWHTLLDECEDLPEDATLLTPLSQDRFRLADVQEHRIVVEYMGDILSLDVFTGAIADAVPAVDRVTTGQYGDGLGSEDEERQLELLLDHLRETDDRYAAIDREVSCPGGSGKCDLMLPKGMPMEAKLIRYWRANGDLEPAMYAHVFSPFHRNTLLTDARQLHASAFGERSGLLGLFYTRAADDPETVEALPERYTAGEIAEKVVRDIEHWCEIDANVCRIAEFDDLQHDVHRQGAVISWVVE